MPARRLLVTATVFYAAMALLSVGIAAIGGDLATLFGEAAPTAQSLGTGAWLGLGFVLLGQLGHRFSATMRRAARAIAGMLGPIGIAGSFYLALWSGFAEELLFRGALWPYMGLVGTSVLFGLVHAVPNSALALWPVLAALSGFALGILREKTGSIWPCAVAHAFVNAIHLALLGRGFAGPPKRRSAPETTTNPVMTKPLPAADLSSPGEWPRTVWRYDMRIDLRGTDRQSLPECLAHETLGIFQYVARPEVYDHLRSGTFAWQAAFAEPFAHFPHDLATLSAYLFQNLLGIEVAERFTDETTTDDVRAWKVVAQRGEWVKVALLVDEPEPGHYVVDPEREDIDILAARWGDYPRWFKDGMRFKHPSLRRL